jgi:hypothetical protein
MWRDSRFGGCSIARSRAEALAGQTEMSEAKVAMTLADVGFFVSLILLGLFLSVRALARR